MLGAMFIKCCIKVADVSLLPQIKVHDQTHPVNSARVVGNDEVIHLKYISAIHPSPQRKVIHDRRANAASHKFRHECAGHVNHLIEGCTPRQFGHISGTSAPAKGKQEAKKHCGIEGNNAREGKLEGKRDVPRRNATLSLTT